MNKTITVVRSSLTDFVSLHVDGKQVAGHINDLTREELLEVLAKNGVIKFERKFIG